MKARIYKCVENIFSLLPIYKKIVVPLNNGKIIRNFCPTTILSLFKKFILQGRVYL